MLKRFRTRIEIEPQETQFYCVDEAQAEDCARRQLAKRVELSPDVEVEVERLPFDEEGKWTEKPFRWTFTYGLANLRRGIVFKRSPYSEQYLWIVYNRREDELDSGVEGTLVEAKAKVEELA